MRSLYLKHSGQGRKIAFRHTNKSEHQLFQCLGSFQSVNYLSELLPNNLVVKYRLAEGFAFQGMSLGVFIGYMV